MLEFIPLRAFSDNYIWLLVDQENNRAAVVDPGDAKPVVTWLGRHPEFTLTHIIITHHHPDHIGGLATLKAATQCKVLGPANEKIDGIDQPLNDGDHVRVLGHELEVFEVPGHTLGHIAYYCDCADPFLLSGDTLFAGGCGRLFEGTPAQMHTSLQRLAALPEQTRVYCAHEYTLANLRFALAVEPDNREIQTRLHVVEELRADDRITLPSSIGLEKQTNPFMRSTRTSVHKAANERSTEPVAAGAETLAVIRQWKDSF
ncbi:hydroxyacylglutathione hydrolase [Halopseudomonas salegens]|uniref:Hydroxyacylglutathione hydrolase n=1 Tax=Halopseudomonas salegens TaxID=1434072 RepID=A0A1H2EW61_9GAMM|nr:hydroxyacylglutathione hydrolase [Halopseudomonas salegens]SDT99203.1 hydroxyacylglutathione hydrolase [Halopseudomonas salegens]